MIGDMRALISFTVISAASYVIVVAVRYFAHRHEIMDIPNERSSHTGSVPRGGGLAIVLVTLVGIWGYSIFYPLVAPLSLAAYTVGAILIAAISWLDDLYSQPNWLRFSIHSIAAVLAIYGFGYLPLQHVLPGNASVIQTLSVITTFIWIVGLTNAYNFMDGIDGIAGGQAVVAGTAWMLLGWLTGHPLIVAFGLLLAASTTGFLVHNWPPARIFMGDVGSAFLGFTLATLPLIFNNKIDINLRGLSAGFAAMIFVWPFVFDSTFTFLRRLRRGEHVFSAHRSHLYQRLVITGRTHRFVSLLYIALAMIGAVLALGWKIGLKSFSLAVAIGLPLLCLGLWIFVSRREHTIEKRLRSSLATYADSVRPV